MLYKWKKASDGTYNIYRVPIFSIHDKSFRDYEIKDTDIDSCKKTMEEKQEQGHLAPIHSFHHDWTGGKQHEKIGYLCNPEIVKHKSLDLTIVSDLIGINQEHFNQIKKGEYPYRSIEGFFDTDDRNKSKIVSLALLNDEAPFFDYTMLYLEDNESHDKVSVSAPEVVEMAEQQFKMEKVCLYTIINKYKERISMTEEEKKKKEEEAEKQNADDSEKVEDKEKEEDYVAEDEEEEKEEDYAESEANTKILDLLEKIWAKLSDGEVEEEEVAEEEMTQGDEMLVMNSALDWIKEGYSKADALKLAKQTYKLKVKQPKRIALKSNLIQAEAREKVVAKEEDYNWSKMQKHYGKDKKKEDFIKLMKKNGHNVSPADFVFDAEKGEAVRYKGDK